MPSAAAKGSLTAEEGLVSSVEGRVKPSCMNRFERVFFVADQAEWSGPPRSLASFAEARERSVSSSLTSGVQIAEEKEEEKGRDIKCPVPGVRVKESFRGERRNISNGRE